MSAALYQGCDVALLTQHGKEALLRAPLAQGLGCRLVHTDQFDTDRLGSFSGDIPRQGSQLQAARAKAQLALALTELPLALASEGAFGPDPYTGMMPWDLEILLWCDPQRELEVVGQADGAAMHLQRDVDDWEAMLAFATSAQFPSHHLVLRTADPTGPVFKGLRDEAALRDAFLRCQSHGGAVCAESDLRAHANPTRQRVIVQAAHNLVAKLQSHCPRCHLPGFWLSQHTPGLPCRVCFKPTRLPVEEIWQCPACQLQEARRLQLKQFADPAHCDACNP